MRGNTSVNIEASPSSRLDHIVRSACGDNADDPNKELATRQQLAETTQSVTPTLTEAQNHANLHGDSAPHLQRIAALLDLPHSKHSVATRGVTLRAPDAVGSDPDQ